MLKSVGNAFAKGKMGRAARKLWEMINDKYGAAYKKVLVTQGKKPGNYCDEDCEAHYATNLFFTRLTNWIRRLAKKNPCGLECMCRDWAGALLNRRYVLSGQVVPLGSFGILKDGDHPILKNVKGWEKGYYQNLGNSQEEVIANIHKLYRDAADRGIITCTRRPEPPYNCIMGTQARRYLIRKRLKKEYWKGEDLSRENKDVMCELRADFRLDICETCCCRNGLVSVKLDTSLAMTEETREDLSIYPDNWKSPVDIQAKQGSPEKCCVVGDKQSLSDECSGHSHGFALDDPHCSLPLRPSQAGHDCKRWFTFLDASVRGVLAMFKGAFAVARLNAKLCLADARIQKDTF